MSVTILTIVGLQSPVFLLNSRTPLVIETCTSLCRHPLYQRYGAILPSSLNLIALYVLAFKARNTFLSYRYGHTESFLFSFSWTLGINQNLRLFAHLTFFSP